MNDFLKESANIPLRFLSGLMDSYPDNPSGFRSLTRAMGDPDSQGAVVIQDP